MEENRDWLDKIKWAVIYLLQGNKMLTFWKHKGDVSLKDIFLLN